MKLKTWLLAIRANFLLLSVVLIFLGICIAWHDGSFHWGYALLTFLGLLLVHISTNTLNEYYDYKSGVDLETKKTPFSGGSGILPAGLLKPASVFRLGIICFILAIPIGVYFVLVKGWLLLPLLIVGAICVLLYTPYLTKIGWPELFAGLGLGTLPVLGAYFVQSGTYTLNAVMGSVPSGILVHNLLFLNEFPDVEADKKAGRKTIPIVLGKSDAAIFYSFLTLAVYIWIIGCVIAGFMPVFALISLLTIPIAVKAVRGALKHEDESKLLPALGANVMVILFTQFLLGISYILDKVV